MVPIIVPAFSQGCLDWPRLCGWPGRSVGIQVQVVFNNVLSSRCFSNSNTNMQLRVN